jgi:diguanylate cyclase (GGDEF)-like protein
MWKSISIRWQLIALMTLALVLIEISILALDNYYDIEQRKSIAIEQAKTLNSALGHDLVRAAIDDKADTYSDNEFRISGFEPVVMMSVFDAQMQEKYRYVRVGFTPPDNLELAAPQQPVFSERFLHIKLPLKVENYQYGETFFLIDLTQYKTGLQEQLRNRLIIFLLQLAIALPLAWWISKNYTRPFSTLADAMKKADPKQLSFPNVETDSKNEIGTLYKGYNKLTAEISIATRHLKYLGEHDALTGLLNRYAIEQKIGECLKHESSKINAIVLFDIDQFKLVNDGAGHAAGDELLKQLGHILSELIESPAKLARVGGDDFLILLPDTDENTAVKLVEKLITVTDDFRYTWENKIFNISACAGLVTFKPCEYTPRSLGIALDTAFYTAKSKGHGQFHVYSADDEHSLQYSSDVHTVSIIKDALQNGEAHFELWAQAIVPLQNQTDLYSYEILLRLKNADGQMIYPDVFLPTANRYQLMVAVDSWVLWKYLETATVNPQHIEKLAFVNINLGGSTLNNPEFQEKIREAINTFDFPWHKLVLEVTETSAVGNLAQASDFIHYCRNLGIRVALDDFGTGMASFEYLKHLPLDVVKIDGSFVRDMLNDPVDHAMVSYVNEISKLRNQETIAEFVELKEHADELKKIGIDYGQGYHLEKPKPLTEWL